MADIETTITLIPGHCFGLRGERHSLDTAREVVKRHLERQRTLIDQQLTVVADGGGVAGIYRGNKEYPLKTFSPTGCRWDGIEEDKHGEQYIGWVGQHEWEAPTEQQVKARTEATIDSAGIGSVEIDGGDLTFKDLGVGGEVELDKPTAGLHSGVWIVTEFEGADQERVNLRRLSTEEIRARRNAESFARMHD